MIYEEMMPAPECMPDVHLDSLEAVADGCVPIITPGTRGGLPDVVMSLWRPNDPTTNDVTSDDPEARVRVIIALAIQRRMILEAGMD